MTFQLQDFRQEWIQERSKAGTKTRDKNMTYMLHHVACCCDVLFSASTPSFLFVARFKTIISHIDMFMIFSFEENVFFSTRPAESEFDAAYCSTFKIKCNWCPGENPQHQQRPRHRLPNGSHVAVLRLYGREILILRIG